MKKIFLTQMVNTSLALSLEAQERIRRDWNARVSDPLAFVPHEIKNKGISDIEARNHNRSFGNFAASYVKRCLERSNRGDHVRRILHSKKIVAVGYGRSYDSSWLREAIDVGLQTWWIDVSDVACTWAKRNLKAQLQKTSSSIIESYQELARVGEEMFHVKCAEIQSALANPQSIGLDLSDVEFWYLSRVLGCLTSDSAEIVLRMVGETLSKESDPEKHNRVILVLALRDDNPHIKALTSRLYKRKMITDHLSAGAGLPVVVDFEDHYLYFNQKYTAMTLRVK